MLEVQHDWSTKPWTVMYLVPSTSQCNSGDELVWSKTYLGSKKDCYRTETVQKVENGETYSEEVCAEQASGIKETTQDVIHNYKICGKRGGIYYKDVIRPDSDLGICPKGFVKCSEATSIENTICV